MVIMTLLLSTLLAYFSYLMERDVNLNLVYIILILLFALGGTAIFYQIKYQELKADYQKSFKTLNETIKNLSETQKGLYDDLGELNVSADRESALAARLEKKTGELDNISIELASVQQELFEYQQKYESLSVDYTITNEILNRHKESIGIMQGKIDRLKNDVENSASKDVILQDIQQLQDELNNFKSY